ncbi:hypothetical protein ACIQFU_32630 [Streptomyces sp. NPDC093065]|uniref:hypothetical protein n=1 Tax=Streptomyces sp. NPDC093065 TaxID=3366021 RepID=UPI003812614E
MTGLGDGDLGPRLRGAVTACDGGGEIGGTRRVGAGDRMPAAVGAADPEGGEAAEARHVVQGGVDGRS